MQPPAPSDKGCDQTYRHQGGRQRQRCCGGRAAAVDGMHLRAEQQQEPVFREEADGDVGGASPDIPIAQCDEGPAERYDRDDPVQQDRPLVLGRQHPRIAFHQPLHPPSGPGPSDRRIERQHPRRLADEGCREEEDPEERVGVGRVGADEEDLRQGGDHQRVDEEYQHHAE